MALFLIANGPMQTTAALVKVTTGAVIKTMLQVKPSATLVARIHKWGVSFDGSAAAQPGQVELIETDVAATVTAHAAADITKLDGDALMCGDPTTNLIQVGVSATGYTASVEGSTTSVRNLDAPQLIAPTEQFIYTFPRDEEPLIQVAKFARIRVTFPVAVNCYAFMVIRI